MKKIAIIGAGPAGLSAAYKLLNQSKEFQVVIFEKDSKVGGLSKSFEFEGGRIDIGGHRFFTKNDEITKFWEDIMPYHEKGMLLRDRKSHILWNSQIISYPIKLNFQTFRALGICKGLEVVLSYLNSKLKNKPISNLEDFYVNRFGKKLYAMFFHDYTYKLWGVFAKQLSADWGEQRIHKISLTQLVYSILFNNQSKPSKERSLINQYKYPAFGCGQLWEELANRIINLGGEIRLECNVERFICNHSSIRAIEHTTNSMKHIEEFDYVISSMPLSSLCASIDHTPKEILEISDSLKYRDMIIVGLEIESSKMGNIYEMAKEDSWLYIQDKSIQFGRLQILNNWSPFAANNKNHLLLELEYFCNKDDFMWKKSDESLVHLAMDELKKCKICNTDAIAISNIVKKIEKAYPVYIDGYYKMDQIRTWLNDFENLQCIGRNGQHRYNNMDHSVETGFIAANNIIIGNLNKEQLWKVNENKENHEQ